MCRVKASPRGEKVLGSIIEPCEDLGILCIKVCDDTDKLVDKAFLRFHNEKTTAHTEIQLDSSDENLFVSGQIDYFQKKGLSPGNYAIIFVKKNGMDFKALRSTIKFEIAAGCFTVIKLCLAPEVQGLIKEFIPDPILEHRELMSQMEADIPEDATSMYCSDCCIDFPSLLEQLCSNTPIENSQITLLGVHDYMPFSIFNEVRGAFDVVDYSSAASKLNVSPVDLDKFLGGMHDKAMKVVFLVPPKPRTMPFKRTSQEFIWYNKNPLAKKHVIFVFGSYNVVSQSDFECYLNGDEQNMRRKQMLRQYRECLKPPSVCPESTMERFSLAKEEFESSKSQFTPTDENADGLDDIDLDDL